MYILVEKHTELKIVEISLRDYDRKLEQVVQVVLSFTTNQLWTKLIPVGGSSTLCPKPDHAGGLDITKVPSWICDLLVCSSPPTNAVIDQWRYATRQ
jgi:hypothetical protein